MIRRTSDSNGSPDLDSDDSGDEVQDPGVVEVDRHDRRSGENVEPLSNDPEIGNISSNSVSSNPSGQRKPFLVIPLIAVLTSASLSFLTFLGLHAGHNLEKPTSSRNVSRYDLDY